MATLSHRQITKIWTRFDKVFFQAADNAHDFDYLKKMLWSLAHARKAAPTEEKLYFAYEQFLVAITGLRHAQACGEVSRMGDWSMWALAETPIESFAQPMEVGRFYDFRNCMEILSSPMYLAANVQYFNGLYDYARRRTAFKEICDAVWTDAWITLTTVMQQRTENICPQEVFLGCTMLTWAAKDSHEKAKSLGAVVERWASSEALPKQLRASFCLTLSTVAGIFSSKPVSYWAAKTLSDFCDCISSLDRVQMMITLMPVDDGGRSAAEEILSQMSALRIERSVGKTMLSVCREAAQTVEFVTPYFVRAMTMADPDLILRGLQIWYQQTDTDSLLDADAMLVTIPFGELGMSLLCGQLKQELARDSQAVLVEVSRKMAELQSTYTTVSGADNSDLPIPERPGFAREYVKGLAEALKNAYCPTQIEAPSSAQCQLLLPTEGHPIQATQLACWGRTWPIASSLSRPLPDRIPKSVLLWCGGVISGPMEMQMVEAAFRRVGAEVRLIRPSTSSAVEFMREYESSDYDVFWVASHGEMDHWSPHEVKLHLAEDDSAVVLDDLWGCTLSSERRRLLVLNVCDGARFAEPGLLPRIGLAAGLASPTQATISHLWPVRYLPSAAFGAYLAYFVAAGCSYFDAYCSALKALQKSAVDVGLELEALYGSGFELVNKLTQSDDDFSGIETWGSGAFFQ